MRKILSLCLPVCVTLIACAPADDPESVARSFVERYYVHPDLSGAKAVAYGLARHKIEVEQRLLQEMDGSEGRGDRGVTYSLKQSKKMGDRIFFVYDITISVDPVVMKKRATIATGETKEGWRVTNFNESDI